MKELTLAQKLQLDDYKKSENREEVPVINGTTLNNIENIQGTHLRSLNEMKVKNLVEKTKEAISKEGKLKEIFSSKKRPKSSEFPRRLEFLEKVDSGRRRNQKKIFEENNCCCCCCCRRISRPKCSSLVNLDSMSWSGCCGGDTSEKGQSEPLTYFDHSSRSRRKCKSNSNFSKAVSNKIFDGEREFYNIKRSLRLLGFELSDFGIESSWEENLPKKKANEKSASFSTKITGRSISLDSLRAAVKRAWMDDCLDESYRRLLAQAAYEEWYFKKEKELWIKRNEERLTRLKAKENLRDHFERKKEKSQEEYRKWLNKKRTKRKIKERHQENSSDRLMKTKEESEKAFLKWKKTKEEELEKKKKEKEKEEERKLKSEKEKNEKKVMAEKAFQLWATKAKKIIISKEAKNQKQKKRQQEMQERRKRKKGRQMSFEVWKAIKDEQIIEKTKQYRVTCKIAREERLAQMEERMYEAEQAFEDWLEKVEARKQKDFAVINDYNKIIPWIPV